MSDPHSINTLSFAEQLNSYHAQIVSDARVDFRYADPMSNVQKVDAICELLRINKDTFDLSAAYPLKEWAKSGDMGLLRCGLYIADLREEFYNLIKAGDDKHARHDVWEAEAEAHFWMEEFDRLVFRRMTGQNRRSRHVFH